MKQSLLLAALVAAMTIHPLAVAPLKVYLVSGQSNMQVFCAVHTFPQIDADSVTKPIHEKMVNPDGTPRVIENVWISTSGCSKDESPGPLTTGYGGGRKGGNIGHELTFGIYIQEHVKEPILIIKPAWGGKSLARDFRPPAQAFIRSTSRRRRKYASKTRTQRKWTRSMPKTKGNATA